MANFFALLSFCVCLLAGICHGRTTSDSEAALELKILHVNDIHAHFDEMNEFAGRCNADQRANNECMGGIGRLHTVVKDLRQQDPELLFLNAGDVYQGTIWYSELKQRPMIEFGNILNFTTMAFGNHEFDDGIDGLMQFVNGVQFPLLGANIVEDNPITHPDFLNKVQKSVVVEKHGQKIGIIGFVTNDTSQISSPDPELFFNEEIKSVKEEAAKLKSDGVNVIIALGHSGYEFDLEMAQQIPDLDVIVGGHSHTFLYTGTPPSVEVPEGPYPTYVTQKSGKVIPVVQVYCFNKYLGHLQLQFDAEGDLLQPVDGVGVKMAQVMFLENSIEKDAGIESKMQVYRDNDLAKYYVVVGQTSVFLAKRRELEESNLGNLLADAMVGEWRDEGVTMALTHNGGIRAEIVAGDITGEDILSVWPFGNTIDKVTMTGRELKDTLEGIAGKLCIQQTCYTKSFVQVSGLKVIYDIKEGNIGNRVTILNPETDEPLALNETYFVALPAFLARHKSPNIRFERSFQEEGERIIGRLGTDVLIDYIKNNSPITTTVEGRVTVNYWPDIEDEVAKGNAGKFKFPLWAALIPEILSLVPLTLAK